MITDPKWTLASFATALDFSRIFEVIQCLTTGFQMAGTAEMGTIEAHVKSNVAAEATFVVDIFVTMTSHLTSCLTESKFL